MLACDSQRGFSLIEVLVAFMILAISLTVIFRIFSAGLRSTALSEDYARAVLVAQAQLSALAADDALAYGVISGAWMGRFRWRRTIGPYQPWPEAKSLITAVNAYRITVDVDWERTGRTHRLTLSSVRLEPVDEAGGLR